MFFHHVDRRPTWYGDLVLQYSVLVLVLTDGNTSFFNSNSREGALTCNYCTVVLQSNCIYFAGRLSLLILREVQLSYH